jgi:hypothetical protein
MESVSAGMGAESGQKLVSGVGGVGYNKLERRSGR